ncbi:MAG TPA: hypothetical protein VFN10_15065 [Thermoanaerobaculia bacterium]|nr:hypothetical protein [Thermoanaerobaculia bacterium]
MPQLGSNILPLIDDQEIRTNFIVEILTSTPRRFTNYRGLTSDGRRGLIVSGNYYRAAIINIPEIEESDSTAPVRVTVSLGNADNTLTDLYSNTANLKKPITITKLWFTGSTWSESLAPTFETEPWFEGKTGKPALRGERLILDCVADTGRRGSSPVTKSRTLMTTHQPLAAGQKLTILSRVAV